MHFRSSKYSGRRNSVVTTRNFRQNQRQRTFDPSAFISRTAGISPVAEERFIPEHAFSDFPITDQLKKNILDKGYLEPTQIQDKTIPLILDGEDVVGLANTGTGKTAAFLIPLINIAFLDRSQRVLIITPTRELAVQIRDEMVQLSAGLNLDSVLCIGGVGIGPQIQRMRRNPQFVIGTPGRLKDLEHYHAINFAFFNNIVLDEVDRMLDIGFVREIKYMISRLPQNRHSLFFSATLPLNVVEIMQSFSNHSVNVSIKSTETVPNIKQEVVRMNGKAKIEALHDLLIREDFSKVLVFGRTKHGIEKLAGDLDRRGFKVAAIHGNKNQNQRQKALADFKNNQVKVLLATDIASRGLDINDVSHVINFDLPETYEDYIHRIGRTGRANKSGVALTFI